MPRAPVPSPSRTGSISAVSTGWASGSPSSGPSSPPGASTRAAPCPVKGRYVVAYEVIDNPQVLRIAARFGLPVVRIASNPRFSGRKKYAPGEFISLIRGAEHVVASSFHAVAVAQIYGVDVIYPPSGTPKDDRILHLLAPGTDLDALRARSLTFLQESLS